MAKGKWAVGAILGVLVGTAVGILTAPKTGKKTRATVKKSAQNIFKSMKDLKAKVK